MAAQTDTRGLYPQSTPGGEAIPFEIVRILGTIKIAIQAAAKDNIALPDVTSFLVLHANSACWVKFGGAIAVPVADTYTANTFYMDADEVVVVDHNGADTISVIRSSADGTLNVNVCQSYSDVRKIVQGAKQ